MGYGDELLGTGMARGAMARGKRVAFGDGKRIKWGPLAAEIFRGNGNVAPPGSEYPKDARAHLEWVEHYGGRRAYNHFGGNRWVWNYDFRATPGEMFFDDRECAFASGIKPGFILIEPNVVWRKSVAPNKDWGLVRYQAVADSLARAGHRVCQFASDPSNEQRRLRGVEQIVTASFRLALSALSRSALYIGPEGGLHHGAAAVSVPGVVMFGGFIPPQVTGYDIHVNLTGGAEACGSTQTCDHCRKAMDDISVDEVLNHALAFVESA